MQYKLRADNVSANASNFEFSAILSRYVSWPRIKLFSFNSHALSKTEQGYKFVEKEALEMTRTPQKFDSFLRHHSFP